MLWIAMIEVTGFLAMQKSVIGFALAFGVLVDAFLVRMTFVPAVLALLDRRALVAAALDGPADAELRHRGRKAPPRA